ncbi:MAG TPA: hypothetical protein VIZ18_12055, partial [Ktedonobacteraceae bacterium]
MSKPERILILTSKTGGGHLSLAESLCDLLASDMPITRDKYEQDWQDTKAATFTIVDPQPHLFHL